MEAFLGEIAAYAAMLFKSNNLTIAQVDELVTTAEHFLAGRLVLPRGSGVHAYLEELHTYTSKHLDPPSYPGSLGKRAYLPSLQEVVGALREMLNDMKASVPFHCLSTIATEWNVPSNTTLQ